MQSLDCLFEGDGNPRDVALALAFWATLVLLGVVLGLSSGPLDALVTPVDVLAEPGLAEARPLLLRRFEVPGGDCSVLLPPADPLVSSEEGKLVVARLPGGDEGAVLAVGSVSHPRWFGAVGPEFLEARRAAFLKHWSQDIEMLRGPFHVEGLRWYRPVVVRGQPGFEAHFASPDLEKRQLELYRGPRCFKFEVARRGAPLEAADVACLYAVLESLQDS